MPNSDHWRALAVAVGLLISGSVAATLLAVPFVFATGRMQLDPRVSSLVTATGFVVVAVGYLRVSGRGRTYLDLRWLTGRELVAAAGLAVGLFAVQVAASTLVPSAFGVTAATSDHASRSQATLLTLLPLAATVVPVSEELLHRNLIQKRLAETLPNSVAVVGAALLFTVLHAANFSGTATGILVGLSKVLASALLLGYVYHRVENLSVTVVAHGAFNALVYGLTYLQSVGVVGGGL